MESIAVKDVELFSHQNWLRSVVRSRLPESDLVDDILNETFSAALEHFQLGRVVDQLGPWLYRVAIRKVLQFRRTQGRFRKFKSRFLESSTGELSFEDNPFEVLVGNERADLVRQAMSQLNGRDAEILTLKYVHDWDYQTISENLGIRKEKIANRLRMARKRLKQHLFQLGIESN